MTTKILSVGGSMIAPDKPDVDFLAAFVKMAKEWLAADSGRRLILVAGGGAPARVYQNAYKEVCQKLGARYEAGIFTNGWFFDRGKPRTLGTQESKRHTADSGWGFPGDE